MIQLAVSRRFKRQEAYRRKHFSSTMLNVSRRACFFWLWLHNADLKSELLQVWYPAWSTTLTSLCADLENKKNLPSLCFPLYFWKKMKAISLQVTLVLLALIILPISTSGNPAWQRLRPEKRVSMWLKKKRHGKYWKAYVSSVSSLFRVTTNSKSM